jgi:23S rRNA (guanine2445-N2)-methyltransferase / 23S rRNA (guanine2069-N7)-methyltransferase
MWEGVRRQADELQLEDIPERIIGMDTDEFALRDARAEAERAGVEDSVHFQPAPFSRLSSKRKYGCLITNPPWFATQTNAQEIFALYRSMPEIFRKLTTWSFFILTDCENFEELLGREADRRRKLYNDRWQCNLFQFAGPKPAVAKPAAMEQPGESESVKTPSGPSRQTIQPAFGQLTAKAQEQAALFLRRLEKRAKHLRRWPTRQGITCFRLYERDIPEIPLVVDQYHDHLHITEYERPHDRDPATHANWLDLMSVTAAKAVGIPPKQVFFKRRSRQRGDTQHQRLGEQNYEIQVQEGGLKFWVNLSDYVDTGLFLDHRITRTMFREASAGKRVVNLFAYTGAFSVYAAAGGASSTTTVDWSNSYLNWARRNMESNDFTGPAHQYVRADATEFVFNLPREELFDLAIVDPPTFSNSKRTERDWEVQQGYVKLLNELLARMSTGGILFFSNNFRQFKFDASSIEAQQIHEISNQTIPPDFRNRRIHRCWRIVK